MSKEKKLEGIKRDARKLPLNEIKKAFDLNSEKDKTTFANIIFGFSCLCDRVKSIRDFKCNFDTLCNAIVKDFSEVNNKMTLDELTKKMVDFDENYKKLFIMTKRFVKRNKLTA